MPTDKIIPRFAIPLPAAALHLPVHMVRSARVMPGIMLPPRWVFGGGAGAALSKAKEKELADAIKVVADAVPKKVTGRKYDKYEQYLSDLAEGMTKLLQRRSVESTRNEIKATLILLKGERSPQKYTRPDAKTGKRLDWLIVEKVELALALTAPTVEVTREFEADALTAMLKRDQGNKLLKMWKDPNGRQQIEGFLTATTTGAGGPGTELNDIARALVSLYDQEPTAPPTVDAAAWESERSQARENTTEEIQQIVDLSKRYPNSRLLSPMRRIAVASWWVSQDPSDEAGHKDALRNRIVDLEQAIKTTPGTETGFAYALLGFARAILER